MPFSKVSIVSGALPLVIIVAALVSIPLIIAWRNRDGRRGPWRRQLLIGIPLTLALVGLTALLVDGLALIPYQFPNSYYLWMGLVFLALVMAVLGWLRAPWWRRVISVASVALTGLMMFTLINQEYQYWPTIGSLVGQNAQFEVTGGGLKDAQDEWKRTKTLPSHGFTLTVRIPATKSNFNTTDAYMWLPPAWVVTPTPKLPVIQLLAGYPGGASDWTRAGFADETSSAYAQAHGGRAPILVMPNATGVNDSDTECVDSAANKVETYLTQDVPSYIKDTFNADVSTGHMAIAGLSSGGACSIMLALRHPDQFRAFGDFSGLAGPTYGNGSVEATVAGLFGGSMTEYLAHDPATILGQRTFGDTKLKGWFAVGLSDAEPLAAQRKLSPLTTRAGIDTCVVESPGAHDFDFFARAFEQSLPWLANWIGAGPPPPATVPDGGTCTSS